MCKMNFELVSDYQPSSSCRKGVYFKLGCRVFPSTSAKSIRCSCNAFSTSEEFPLKSDKDICGNFSIKRAHEYRLLFAVPSLDEQTLDDWWQYAQQVSAELVKPDENHDFSLLSVILAAGETDKSVLKKLKKLSNERKYQSGKHGWSSIRLAVVDLDTHKVHTNRMGDSLKNILQPLV